MSLISFTKNVISGDTFQDVAFKFGTNDDDPLLSHGVILGFYSRVFSKMIIDSSNNRDALHRIQISIIDSNKETYQAFINGIYSGFTDKNSKTLASKDLFQLVQKYQLSQDLVENLFSVSNVWYCLEFALASPDGSSGSFLLPKCEKMLKVNKSVYKDPKALKSIDASTIVHALKQKKLPLKKNEVKEFIDLWKEVNKGKENLQENLSQIYENSFLIFLRDEPWQTPILNVSSPDLPTFSVEYEPSAKLQQLANEVSFVTQVEKPCICIHQSQSRPEMDFNSESNLKDLGLNEGDEVVVKLKKKISLREMSGHEFHVYVKDDEMVDVLKDKVYKELEATGNHVKAFHLTLVKDQNRLEDGKTLLESGVKESSLISVVVGDRKRIKRIMDVNIAADHGTKSTASSSSSNKNYGPEKALPTSTTNNPFWYSAVKTPSWWCVEFSEPKIVARLKYMQAFNDRMSYRVEVGNDNVNWTTVFTQEMFNYNNTHQYTNDFENHLPSRFCRIHIENIGGHNPHLRNVIMNEAVWE